MLLPHELAQAKYYGLNTGGRRTSLQKTVHPLLRIARGFFHNDENVNIAPFVKVSAGVGADQDYGNLFKTCLDSLGKPSGRPDGFFTHQPSLLNDAQTAFTHSITLAALSKASSASPLPNIRVPCSGVVFIKPHAVIRTPFNTPAANLKHFIHKFYRTVAEGGFSNTPEKSFQGFAARSLCDWNV
jgi:hypothetical protein